MHLSPAHVSFVATFIPGAFATPGALHAPSAITAGTDVQVVLEPNVAYAKASKAVDYRLYLSAGAAHYVLSPLCFLSPHLPINETTTTINIPKDVGPDGSTYRIQAWYAQTFEWSDYITLTGSTLANWSAVEPIGMKLWDAVPCSAMNCFRQCNEKNHAAHKEGTWWTNTILCSCLRKCPGVDTTNPYYGGGDGCGWEWRIEDEEATQTLISTSAKPTGTATFISSSISPHSSSSHTTAPAPEVLETATPGSATVGTVATPLPSKAQAAKKQLHTSLVLIFGIALLMF
ncbi:uncharacterized protein BP5553_09890 [Venustampulla echinocandica]|uniref:Uncharacterized protein n=1 Tax=Venustampulla echinocandica TaxID=2656787 RepID=A0A370TAZ6_9HELO|nr:uncharacterized protein BP5553_09890 [Venustampulla echinocandica]RDL31101.1 hypothetical protein BP5553_09890 [Venustampulla echinocandica]